MMAVRPKDDPTGYIVMLMINFINPDQKTLTKQIETILRLIDPHGLSQAARAAREVEGARYAAVALHDIDALDRIEGTDQHARSHARRFA